MCSAIIIIVGMIRCYYLRKRHIEEKSKVLILDKSSFKKVKRTTKVKPRVPAANNVVKNERKPMGIAEFIEREEKDIEMKGGMEKQ